MAIIFGITFGGIGLAMIGFLWTEHGFGDPPMFFKIFGTLIALPFVSFGGMFLLAGFGLRKFAPKLSAQSLAERLKESRDELSDQPKVNSGLSTSYTCPHCARSARFLIECFAAWRREMRALRNLVQHLRQVDSLPWAVKLVGNELLDDSFIVNTKSGFLIHRQRRRMIEVACVDPHSTRPIRPSRPQRRVEKIAAEPLANEFREQAEISKLDLGFLAAIEFRISRGLVADAENEHIHTVVEQNRL